MKEVKTIAVGDTYYFEPLGNYARGRTKDLYKGVVEKVARKYVYVRMEEQSWPVKFDKELKYPTRNEDNGDYNVFFSEEEYKLELLKREQLGEIRDLFSNRIYACERDIPCSVVQQIYNLLKTQELISEKKRT